MRRNAGSLARHPMAEGESADEDGYPGQQAVEEIECADRPDADEIKQRALDAQVREGLVQALVDPVPAPVIGVCLHCKPLTLESLSRWRLRLLDAAHDQMPQSQLRTLTASTAMPVPAATPARVFFAPGSPWANW